MKYFPIKIAVICLFATPLLYNFTLSSYEKYLNTDYTSRIENILIGDASPLLKGSIRIEEQIANNIQSFLKNDWIIQTAKLAIKVQVTTSNGKIIYPMFLDVDSMVRDMSKNLNTDTIIKENFDILNNGLRVAFETNIRHGSGLGNLILILYCGISLLIFLLFYRTGSSKEVMENKKISELIGDLKNEEQNYKKILKQLKTEREEQFVNITSLNAQYKDDTKKARINEEVMFEEIISLEEKLQSFAEMKERKEIEIEELKTKIQKFGRRKSSKSKRNEFDFISKRFVALYKTVVMNRKAMSGFLSLNEELQIKAEEMISLLDRNPENITIKRKVFSGKKHRTACFEVLFAYNGRLYFRKKENNIIEVAVVGTKNTQAKDMEFIHSL